MIVWIDKRTVWLIERHPIFDHLPYAYEPKNLLSLKSRAKGNTMIYFTQLIYIKEGEEDTFNKFEDVALPLLEKYNGSLLLRIRPTESQVIERTVELPYEIHLVSFPTETDFENFKGDKTREDFLHLKEKAIRSVLLIKGQNANQ